MPTQATFYNPITKKRYASEVGKQTAGSFLEEKIASPADLPNYVQTNKIGADIYGYKKPVATIPQGAVAIPGAQYSTKEAQQGAFNNIQPIGGTLYGVPKVADKITTDNLTSDASATLTDLLEQNRQTTAQRNFDTFKTEAETRNTDMQKSLDDFNKQYQESFRPTEQQTQLTADLATKQAEIASKQQQGQQYKLETEKQISGKDFDSNLLSSQVGKSQAQIARERAFGGQEIALQQQGLSMEEANIINRLNLSNEQQQQIQQGLLTGYQLQQTIHAQVEKNAETLYQEAQKLDARQQEDATNIISSLQGTDVSKLSPTLSSQLTQMFMQANIPVDLGFKMLQQAYDSATIKEARETDTKMLSAGYQYIPTPQALTDAKKAGRQIIQQSGRSYAKMQEERQSAWSIQEDEDGRQYKFDSKTGEKQYLSESVSDLMETGAIGGQCGDYVHKIADNIPALGDTIQEKNKKTNISASAFSQDQQVGDVIISTTNLPYGHVSLVTKVNGDGTVEVTESNYGLDEKVGKRTVSVNDPKITGIYRGAKLKTGGNSPVNPMVEKALNDPEYYKGLTAKEQSAVDKYSADNGKTRKLINDENLKAYAEELATTGKIPTGLPSGSLGQVLSAAKLLPKKDGQIYNGITGLKDSAVPTTEQEDLGRLYNIINMTKKLEELDKERIGGVVAGSLGKITGSDAQGKYLVERKAIIDELARMQTGAALTKEEQAFYEDYLPGRFSEPFGLGRDSDKVIADFKEIMMEKLNSSMETRGLEMVGREKHITINGKKTLAKRVFKDGTFGWEY